MPLDLPLTAIPSDRGGCLTRYCSAPRLSSSRQFQVAGSARTSSCLTYRQLWGGVGSHFPKLQSPRNFVLTWWSLKQYLVLL